MFLKLKKKIYIILNWKSVRKSQIIIRRKLLTSQVHLLLLVSPLTLTYQLRLRGKKWALIKTIRTLIYTSNLRLMRMLEILTELSKNLNLSKL